MNQMAAPAPPITKPGTDAEAELLRVRSPQAPARSADELLHELQVHKIELEMQNEALREAQLALEEARDRYVDLYEFAPVGYLTLGAGGQVVEINLTGAGLLGADRGRLEHAPFSRFVGPEDQAGWQRFFRQAWQNDGRQSCELSLRRANGAMFVASLVSARSAAGKAAPSLRVALTDVSERWRSERALQESETRFRAMADVAPVLIWMSDVDKGCSWFNQQWLAFTGRTMAQEVGTGWTESVHAEDIERCLQCYCKAFDSREKFEIEYRLRRADGHYRWVLDSGVPRYGADQEFLGYIGSCVDITRLKRAEEDLNRAQSVAHIGNWRFDVLRQQFKGSLETQHIFGVRDGAPLSYDAFLARIHPDDRQQVDLIWHGGSQGEPYDVEHRLQVDGDVKWVREKAELEFDARGQLRGAFGITQDVTQLKEARRALIESEERFHAFMTHSPVASWIVDIEGRFQYVSPTLYQLFGLASTDLVGKRIGEIFPAEFAEKYLLGNQAAIEAMQPMETIEPGLLADGSQREFLVIRFPIRDTHGQTSICGMALDLTERRQTVAQLREANERLERLAAEQAAHLRELARELTQAEQRERDHLYGLLHDEVQPLLVAARLSLSGLSSRTPPADCLRVAAEACAHISQVIPMARTLSLQLSPPLVRERGLIPALESLCRWMREHHGLAVDLLSAPEAESDDMTMRLLCFNAVRELLMNAVKHAGTASVTLTLDLVDHDTLRITVADRGSGFDPATISSGSGLSAIQRRLGMLGGKLLIDSRPAHGTVATLMAPRRLPAASGSSLRSGDRRRRDGGNNAQDTDRG